MGILIVTAVDAERDAILAQAPTGHVIVGGVGPAAAAASTSRALATDVFDLAISAGIAGGFAPLATGAIAVASACAFADLGAESDNGFVPLSSLGFGVDRYDVSRKLAVELTDATGGHMGTILTVATVTGSPQTRDELQARYPDAVAEAMEGAGVAAAAQLHGVEFAEVRAISNIVGRRDRDAWDIPGALNALGSAIAAVLAGESTP